MRGSTTISHGSAVLFVHSDANGNGLTNVPIPNSPDPNTIITGTNEQSGINGTFRWIFNEQIINSDGSLTVNAAHEFLGMNQPPPPASESPAKGELIIGHVVCGVTPTIAPPVTTDAAAPTCTVLGFRRAPTPPDPSLPSTDEIDVLATDPGGGPLGQAGRGLRSLTNVVVSNGTVNTTSRFWGTNRPPVWGTPVPTVSNFPAQGDTMTAVIATKTNQGSPMTFSFDVTDEAGVSTHCSASESNIAGAVVGLSASAANASAVVAWSPPSSNGGSAVTAYTVSTNAPSGGSAPAAVSVAASSCSPTCSTTVTGLSNSLTLAGHGGYTFTVYATNSVGNGVSSTSNTVFPQVTAGELFPVTPGRILDTRAGGSNYGTCSPAPCATLGAGSNPETYNVKVAGETAQNTSAALVPPSGASAVVLNVTIVNPSQASVLTVWPSTAAQPGVSNLNWVANQPATPNLVTAALGTDGNVDVNNAFGSVDVIADVVGYYGNGAGTAGARFNAVTPGRILDTRPGGYGTCSPSPCATLGAGSNPETYNVKVAGETAQNTGAALVPPSGASAVVMNVTIVNPNSSSFLTVWPSSAAQPGTSNSNWVANQGATPNLVTVALGSDGNVDINNAFGSVDVIADVVGWYTTAGSISGTRFAPLTPGRILDTRSPSYGSCTPSPCATLGSGSDPQTYSVKVAGELAQNTSAALVPASGATAVVMNTTIVNPTAASFLTVWPSTATQPGTSNLNWVANQGATPNLVVVGLGSDGNVKIGNFSGAVDAIADAAGWFNDGTS